MAIKDRFVSRPRKYSDDYDEDRTFVRKTVERPAGKADPMKWHGQEYYDKDGNVLGRSLTDQDSADLRAWWDAPKSAPVGDTPVGPYQRPAETAPTTQYAPNSVEQRAQNKILKAEGQRYADSMPYEEARARLNANPYRYSEDYGPKDEGYYQRTPSESEQGLLYRKAFPNLREQVSDFGAGYYEPNGQTKELDDWIMGQFNPDYDNSYMDVANRLYAVNRRAGETYADTLARLWRQHKENEMGANMLMNTGNRDSWI